jgi:hypothetical protein
MTPNTVPVPARPLNVTRTYGISTVPLENVATAPVVLVLVADPVLVVPAYVTNDPGVVDVAAGAD